MLLTIQKNNAFFRQLLFLVVLCVIGVVMFDQLKFFVGSALGAITLYVVFRNLLFRMTDQWRWKPWVAALALVLINSVVLVALGYLIFKVVAAEIPAVDTSSMVGNFNDALNDINHWIGFNLIPHDILSKSGGTLSKVAGSIVNTTYSFAANIFMMLIILYFMFAAGRRMESVLVRYSPFKDKSLYLLKREIKTMIYSNAVLMPFIMLAQTLGATLIYWILGVPSPWFWGFLTALCGLIPLIGSGIVYVPMGIYFVATGEILTGIIIVAYGLLVVSNIDNLIRIVMLKSVANTHPLVVIFGVILGIPLFGFWGIIFGPLFISGFMSLIKIYYVEYGLFTSQESVEAFCCDEAADASLVSRVKAAMTAAAEEIVEEETPVGRTKISNHVSEPPAQVQRKRAGRAEKK